MKQIIMKINSNGVVEAETLGIKGKDCLKYIDILETLTESRTVDSDFTSEYMQNENNEAVTVDEGLEISL